jgi:threonine aldolase
VRKIGMLAAAAREAVLENFGPGDVDTRGILGAAHGMASAVARMWTDRGGRLSRPTETNMVWLDLESAGITPEGINNLGMRNGILVAAPRIILHHQICSKALASLEQMFDDLLVRRQFEVSAGLGHLSVQSKGCVQSMR